MVPVSKSRFRGIVFTSFQTIEQANPNILQALFTNKSIIIYSQGIFPYQYLIAYICLPSVFNKNLTNKGPFGNPSTENSQPKLDFFFPHLGWCISAGYREVMEALQKLGALNFLPKVTTVASAPLAERAKGHKECRNFGSTEEGIWWVIYGDTVDGRNMKKSGEKTAWDVRIPANNGINYQPQLVQDFFHVVKNLDVGRHGCRVVPNSLTFNYWFPGFGFESNSDRKWLSPICRNVFSGLSGQLIDGTCLISHVSAGLTCITMQIAWNECRQLTGVSKDCRFLS